ncbi:MAG: phenylacetate-CoA oxygenase subunit PaaJ [Ignavibacteriales bacterium]|nr:phenylacetate-CoA oxygenase subunit PaaJ [Ignavibacteriales bacterium]
MVETKPHTTESIREILSSVLDPEIPVLSVIDMGIIREIGIDEGKVTVTITPTYSGCPAMHVIEESIRSTLLENGIDSVTLKTTFSPAWTTDWLSDTAKKKMNEYGIAPPVQIPHSALLQIEIPKVPCPYCHSSETQLKSEFGSTACKAYYFCISCHQPFEFFKPL